MKLEITNSGITLLREPGDKRIGKESTVTYHMRNLLNEHDGRTTDSYGAWRRFYPDRVGLTSCRQGVWNPKTKVAYWHERYQIEDAAEQFNKHGRVFYMAAAQ